MYMTGNQSHLSNGTEQILVTAIREMNRNGSGSFVQRRVRKVAIDRGS